jgi:hypothetical protein
LIRTLSYLNARLTHYLDRIGLPHTVKFQNDLTVSIEELGRELDFDNLSRGERNQTDPVYVHNYTARINRIQHMTWLYQDTPIETLPEECVGFVYLITNNLTGRKYIGKKLAKFSKTTYKTVKQKNGIKEEEKDTIKGRLRLERVLWVKPRINFRRNQTRHRKLYQRNTFLLQLQIGM